MADLSEIQETFSLLNDWEERYAYLIDLGRSLAPLTDAEKTDENFVRGCTSKVWMVLTVDNGIVHLRAESDAHIVRGLVALVIAVYDGAEAAHIDDIDMEAIFDGLGLGEHLSPNRRNGFFAMVDRIRKTVV